MNGTTHALELVDVAARRGGRDVVRHASATLTDGLVLLTGGNGAGKSTLLTVIAGIVPLGSGTVRIDGHDLVRSPVAAKRAVGLLPERNDAFAALSPRAWLGFVAAIRDVPLVLPDTLLGELTRTGALDRPMATLSAGQRRKVALAAAVCGTPRLLLLDEPTNALDDDGVAYLEQIVTTWCAEGRAVVCAMHQPGAWLTRASQRWHVDGGRLHVDAPTNADVSTRPGPT